MRLTPKAIKSLWIAFIIVSAIVMLQNVIIFNQIGEGTTGNFQVSRDATVALCINNYPQWLNPVSCPVAFTLANSQCNISATDPDGDAIVQYNVTVVSGNPNGTNLFTDVSSNGILTFNASFNQTGNYTLHIEAQDNSTCFGRNTTTANLEIRLSSNAPVLLQPIPDSTQQEGQTIIPYDLDQYFRDPEGGPLLYRAEGNTQISINISSAGEVTLRPAIGYCGEEIVYFVATDIENLSTSSNNVTLTVECVEEEEESATSPSSSGGGGGGGGGGFASQQSSSCVEDRFCYEWTDCQYTSAVTETGDPLTLNITGVRGERTYLIDGDVPENTSIFYNGYRYRECIDTNSCRTRSQFYTQYCQYEPSCTDGIQNQDETGVDCGGSCRPCGLCNDGVQNGYETGLDCGGPDCAPCHTCQDGIVNGRELGVDCGGPDCPVCETCFDGIQNQGETGVDCGGPCRLCAEEQDPAALVNPLTQILFVLTMLALAAVASLLLARKHVSYWMAAAMLRYKTKNRLIILSNEEKNALLDVLQDIEGRIEEEPEIQIQSLLGRLARNYAHAALGLVHEYRSEALDPALKQAKLHPLLQEVLRPFFLNMIAIEFSREPHSKIRLRAFIEEMRFVIESTGVTTVSELKQRSMRKTVLPDMRTKEAVQEKIDVGLLTCYKGLNTDNFLIAEDNYARLHELYPKAPLELQRVLYGELHRVYNELILANHLESRIWNRKRR